MMDVQSPSFYILLGTAAQIALIHTIIGIDHSLPFVVLGRSQNWSLRKTLGLTFLCGLGHVLSSVILGMIGVFASISLQNLKFFEETRGNWAGWLLIIFGFSYAGWAFARQRKQIKHLHHHGDDLTHSHPHSHFPHSHDDLPAEGSNGELKKITAWSLFIIFIFGPCEPLIPLLMYPALKLGWYAVFFVTLTFSVVTIGTMLLAVFLGYKGAHLGFFRKLEPHMNTLAGMAIAFSGLAIQFGL